MIDIFKASATVHSPDLRGLRQLQAVEADVARTGHYFSITGDYSMSAVEKT